MKYPIFTRSIQFLIVTLLILAALKWKYSQQLMLGTILLWLLVTAGFLIYRKLSASGKFHHPVFSGLRNWLSIPAERPDDSDTIAVKDTYSMKESSEEHMTAQELETMLRHISLRITAKLKSAYPQAIWSWKDSPSLHDILAGKTVRISVEDMECFTHADVSFDRFGRIHVEPMVIGTFAESCEIPAGKDPQEDVPTAAEPAVVDVRVWYDLIGQKALETLITELHANGHSKLTIKENGDVVVRRQKKDVLQDTLEAFPGRNYWDELISILEENELNGKIAGNDLQISWI